MSDRAYVWALQVLRTLRHAGFEAYLAGGCVRDHLLGLAPKDYDVATSAKPDEVASLFPRTVMVGREFGVVKVLSASAEVEVAMFRTEGRYADGRRPESVRPSTALEDVRRRDFTVNGMLWDPIDGRIMDEVGGRRDLGDRVIRTIGDPGARFDEDRLRMLRAVRFACQLDFTVEPETVRAISAKADRIVEVSFERIAGELRRLVTGPRRSRGLGFLLEWGLLRPILPELCEMVGVAQPPEFHPEGDVWTHTLLTLDGLDQPTFVVALGALLHDVGKPSTYSVDRGRIRFNGHDARGEVMAREICRRLRLSNEETEGVAYLVANHMKFKDVARMRPSTLKKLLREPGFQDLKTLCRADVLAASRDLSSLDFVEDAEKKFGQEELRPAPLVTGRDLIEMGLAPGPLFGQILKNVEELQLEGLVKTKEEALEHVRKAMKSRPG